MSEYVIEIPDYVPPFDPLARAATLGEEIIRCRDCDHRRRSWNGHKPNFTSYFFCAYTGGHEVKPDGFCAWGKRIVRCRDCVSCYRDEVGLWCCLHGTGFYRKPTDADNYCSKGKRRDA